MKKSEHRKIYKYQVLALILLFISLILMFLSLCLFIPQKIVGILQGISTGLLSGMVILLITGIKSQEQRKLQYVINTVHKWNDSLLKMNSASSNCLVQLTVNFINQQTSFNTLKSLLTTVYTTYKNEYDLVLKIDTELFTNDIQNKCITFINDFSNELNHLNNLINKNITDHESKKLYMQLNTKISSFSNQISTLLFYLLEYEYYTKNEVNRIDNNIF